MSETISTLGKILPAGHAQGRDAIHIAVMPVVAGETLRTGEKIKLLFGTVNTAISAEVGDEDDFLGRADPFLEEWKIEKGEEFWMWLRPGTITGLRHEWTHPTIDKTPQNMSESEAWLCQFADKWNFDYGEMINEAMDEEGCVTAMGRDLHGADELEEGDEELFWRHIEALAGRRFDGKHREGFIWSCSC